MKIRFFILLFSCLGFILPGKSLPSFEPTRVILVVNRDAQKDSTGFNLTNELPRLIYSKILDGTVSLWDSPSKDIRISAEALKGIESSSRASFAEADNLFIYELWEYSKRYLDCKTLGFAFTGQSPEGAVSFGYVDYREVSKMLDEFMIPSNAYGYSNTTFREAVLNKHFQFSMVQFGEEILQNDPKRANELRESLFLNPKVKHVGYNEGKPQEKMVVYEIYPNGNAHNEALFTSMKSYFQENPEQFLNLGGDQVISYLNKTPEIRFGKLQITEVFTKNKNEVSTRIQTVQIFVNGQYLPAVSASTLEQISMVVNFQSLKAFLDEKKFEMAVTRINTSDISPSGQSSLMRRLLEGNWDLR